MKVPCAAPRNHESSNPKPFSRNYAVRSGAPPLSTVNGSNLCYEPRSVLERPRSPSPVADRHAAESEVSAIPDDALIQFDDPSSLLLVDNIPSNSQELESLARELGFYEDSIKPIAQLSHCQPQYTEFGATDSFEPSQFDFNIPELLYSNQDLNLSSFGLSEGFHHQMNSVGLDVVDELIHVAECFDSNETQAAQAILARLNQQLPFPIGKPVERAAFYFKEALQSLFTNSNPQTRPSSSSSEIVQTIKAYRVFSNLSPILMFSNFTANQAILEAVEGSMLIHVVDFDIGLGGQWASFMKEIADKADSRKASRPVLRITAVVPEEYAVESRLIRDNLSQFALELTIGFDINFVSVRTFEVLSSKAFKFMAGEKTAVLLSPTIFRRIGAGFLSDIRRISPHVVVYVDSEGTADGGTSSFRGRVINGLEFYTTVLESLEAAINGGGGDWISGIERSLLRPKIFESIEAAGRHATPLREMFTCAGMRPVALSRFADFQAECLLRRMEVMGFHVAKRQAEMLLCWRERALVATSAWKC